MYPFLTQQTIVSHRIAELSSGLVDGVVWKQQSGMTASRGLPLVGYVVTFW